MTVLEFGKEKPRVLILLHGGGLSWWNYRKAAEELSELFHVVLPVLDGHAGSDASFTSIEDNASRIVRYIDEHFGGEVTAIAGLSLGGQVALEILSQKADICRFALIESALVKPSRLTHALIGPSFSMSYGLIKQKWFAKLQASYLGIPQDLFEDYFRDTCRITKEDMIAFLKANSIYRIKPTLAQTSAKVHLVAGSREQKSILDSARYLQSAIPGSTLEFLPGYRHGDLSINHPAQYAQILQNLIK